MASATTPQFGVFDFGSILEETERLNKGALAAENTKEPLIKISVQMMEAEDALFASQGRRGGGSWKHIKPETAERKGSSVILIDTGTLRDSLTKPNAPFQILRIGNTELEFGTSAPAAAALHEGSSDGSLPARPLLRFTGGDVDSWIRIIEDHLLAPHR